MCYTAQLVPIIFGWVMAEWLRHWLQQWGRGVCPRFWGLWFNIGIHLMKQFAHNWYLPCYQCTETCSHASFIQNNTYTPVPGASSPVENSSCPESNRCCNQCVILLSWCQSMLNGSWLNGSDAGYNSEGQGVSLRFLGPRFNTGIHLINQFAHNLCLPCCQCTEIYSHVCSPVENRSCSESTCCCNQWVIALSWWQSVLDGSLLGGLDAGYNSGGEG